MIKEIKGKDFRKMQLTELDMLVEFDKVCRKYNIPNDATQEVSPKRDGGGFP